MVTFSVHVADDVYMRFSIGDDGVVTLESMYQHTHNWQQIESLRSPGSRYFVKLYQCECGGFKEVSGQIGSAMPEVFITEPGIPE